MYMEEHMRQAQSSAIVAVMAMFLLGCETQNDAPSENDNLGNSITISDGQSCTIPHDAFDGGTVELQDCGSVSESDPDALPPDLYPRGPK
jgi:hypothetical protein